MALLPWERCGKLAKNDTRTANCFVAYTKHVWRGKTKICVVRLGSFTWTSPAMLVRWLNESHWLVALAKFISYYFICVFFPGKKPGLGQFDFWAQLCLCTAGCYASLSVCDLTKIQIGPKVTRKKSYLRNCSTKCHQIWSRHGRGWPRGPRSIFWKQRNNKVDLECRGHRSNVKVTS